VISVGATTRGDILALFSNFGSWVSVAGPGDAILSSVPGGGYAAWSGTSMATPLVAGEAALILAANPGLDERDVAARIVGSATKIGGTVPYRIDAASALGIPAP